MKLNILTIQNEPFFKELEKQGQIFFVGGSIRDEILGLESKDIDLLIKGIAFEEIELILKPFGKSVMNLVGGKQAVLKFSPIDSQEVIDISIPRTETKTSDGHQGFDVQVDPNLPLEKDLKRRDFTINSFARDKNFKYVDPFGGIQDLENKLIRVTNPDAFSEDPLRMLRAIGFASRFKFQIEKETLELIKKNASNIKSISGERVLVELTKIIQKGNPYIGLKLLKDTGLFNQIFGRPFKGDIRDFNQIKSIGEFIFCLLKGFENPHLVFKKILKGDIDTAKEIEAYNLAFSKLLFEPWENRILATKMYKISPESLKSQILNPRLKKAISEIIKEQKYPISLKEVMINGDDLTLLKFKDKQIGDKLSEILILIMKDKLKNKRESLISFCKNNI